MGRVSLEHRKTPFVRLMYAYSRRRYGKLLDPGVVALHHHKVLFLMLRTQRSLTGWRSLPADVSSLAVMAPAAIGCSRCMDFGYRESVAKGVPVEKVRAVSDWRSSTVFDDHDRQVLSYAEAMTATPPEVADEMVERLKALAG